MSRIAFSIAVIVPALLGCCFGGCDGKAAREMEEQIGAGPHEKPHPNNPKWVVWRNCMSAFLSDARVAVNAIEKNEPREHIANNIARIGEAFNALPSDIGDPAEIEIAGKLTVLTSNARTAQEKIEAIAVKRDVDPKADLRDEIREIRFILDGIEADPFFGK